MIDKDKSTIKALIYNFDFSLKKNIEFMHERIILIGTASALTEDSCCQPSKR